MSIPLLIETHSEVRRLLIAGSGLAAEDFRLKKLLPQMKKAGENVQVFARVADAMGKVIESGSEGISENLLELANLVNAILYTQGQTGLEGDISDICTADLSFSTDIPYRRLKPVIEALTSKGAGRLGIIREAQQKGIFKDIRLIMPLIEALGETYPDISDYVYNILEQYGKCIVPVLKGSLDTSGGRKEARKVELISQLLCGEGNAFYIGLLENSSLEVKISALKAMKYEENNENILLEYSSDRKKEIREAALGALAALNTEAAGKRLCEVFSSKDRSTVFAAMRSSQSRQVVVFLLSEAEKAFDILLKSVKTSGMIIKKHEITAAEDDIYNFVNVVECLQNKKYEGVLEFYKKCLQYTSILAQMKFKNANIYGGAHNVAHILAGNVILMGTKEAYELINSSINKYDNCLIAFAFFASLFTNAPEEVFEKYSKYVAKGRKDFEGQELLGLMDGIARFESDFPVYYYQGSNISTLLERTIGSVKVRWDKRWLRVLINMDEEDLVCRLAMKGNEECILYLLKKIDICKKNKKSCWILLHGLIQAGYSNSTGLAMELLKDSFEQTGFYIAELDVLKILPREAAESIENFAHSWGGTSEARKLLTIAQEIRSR